MNGHRKVNMAIKKKALPTIYFLVYDDPVIIYREIILTMR